MAKDIRPWQILDSRYLVSRPWLTARRDTVLNPGNGVVNDEYYVLEYPKWVNIIAITDDDRFVLVRQYRHGLGIIARELCAGVVEQGEEPLEAARRELLEETGYGGGEWRELMTIGQNPGTCNNLTHCFLARGVKRVDSQHLDATEDIEVVLMTENQLLDLMRQPDSELKQALMLAPLWRYFAEKR